VRLRTNADAQVCLVPASGYRPPGGRGRSRTPTAIPSATITQSAKTPLRRYSRKAGIPRAMIAPDRKEAVCRRCWQRGSAVTQVVSRVVEVALAAAARNVSTNATIRPQGVAVASIHRKADGPTGRFEAHRPAPPKPQAAQPAQKKARVPRRVAVKQSSLACVSVSPKAVHVGKHGTDSSCLCRWRNRRGSTAPRMRAYPWKETGKRHAYLSLPGHAPAEEGVRPVPGRDGPPPVFCRPRLACWSIAQPGVNNPYHTKNRFDGTISVGALHTTPAKKTVFTHPVHGNAASGVDSSGKGNRRSKGSGTAWRNRAGNTTTTA
jgi:hypothetical protein